LLHEAFFLDGAGSALATFVSQAHGAGNGRLAGLWLQTTLCYSACFAPLVLALW
jgi:Na+-driven multidrug efflux pump